MKIILDDYEKDVLQRAWEQWGTTDQLFQLFEELAETILAVNHHRRGRNTTEDVYSELADSIIMITQLSIMLGQDDGLGDVENHIEHKIKRLDKRLGNL